MNNIEGNIIRHKRLCLGMTQEQVALELDMSIRQYQRYEYGEHKLSNCPMRVGLRLCAFFELDPFDMVIFQKQDEL
ncbi:MAG: helix-turn-helix transcriptional regulator [Ruminococcus sp.]|jgi:transcriptional regulator with XRE-family HTH domain|nr:helix-turn-helix transcriptional regulator [Ruminococcus sp.]MEE0871879.1 helix-turn-helix transcriptional regulator [Ruminococcus sp.]MEE0981660.1 helix-turn-helix transcriptional regulator [Acutalibacteraceae bacterium]